MGKSWYHDEANAFNGGDIEGYCSEQIKIFKGWKGKFNGHKNHECRADLRERAGDQSIPQALKEHGLGPELCGFSTGDGGEDFKTTPYDGEEFYHVG